MPENGIGTLELRATHSPEKVNFENTNEPGRRLWASENTLQASHTLI